MSEEINKGKVLEPGSYSTGSLLEKDLLDMFDTIGATIECRWYEDKVAEGYRLFDHENYEATQWVLEELFDHTEEFHVADGFRFGTHEGDGADFGVWDCEDPHG